MNPQRVAVAVPLADGNADLESFIPVFHDWIRRAAVDGRLIDVARYGHVEHGPGVMLIGHDGDYSIERADGSLWLRYTIKRDNRGSVAEVIGRALTRLAGAQGALPGSSRTDPTRLRVTVTDRLNERSSDHVASAASDAVDTVLGTRPARVERVGDTDPRAPVALELTLPAA